MQFLDGLYYFPSIVNIDETNIYYFDIQAVSCMLADKVALTISLRTNHGKQHALHMLLGVAMSGEKRAPFCFQRST